MGTPAYETPEWLRRVGELECRACGVICERVVLPGHCLRSSCRYVYAVRENGVTYFGCVEQIFVAELDVSPFEKASRVDLYGALRARRRPRPECRSHVEQAYGFKYSWNSCVNPVFLRDPATFAPEAVRRLVHGDDGVGTS
ncbi:MAG: hypothetical protein ACYCX3_03245 [Thermoleophilia bacterium]